MPFETKIDSTAPGRHAATTGVCPEPTAAGTVTLAATNCVGAGGVNTTGGADTSAARGTDGLDRTRCGLATGGAGAATGAVTAPVAAADSTGVEPRGLPLTAAAPPIEADPTPRIDPVEAPALRPA